MKNYNLLLNEVRSGSTKVGERYIKHPTLADQAREEGIEEKFYNKALEKGLPTEVEAISKAKKEGRWTEKDDADISGLSNYINKLLETEKTVHEGQLEQIRKTIDEQNIALNKLKRKRNKELGMFAEEWSRKFAFELYIPSLIFNDPECSSRTYPDEDIDYIEDDDLDSAFTDFIYFNNRFKDDTLKEMAVYPPSQNMMYIAEDCNLFYGKPAIELTMIQSKFFIYIKNYNSIITNISGKVRDSILGDWKKLDEWGKAPDKTRERLEDSWGMEKGNVTFENIRKMAGTKFKSKEEEAKAKEKFFK